MSSVISYDVSQVLAGSATPSTFANVGVNVPTSVAFDTAGNVYVANRASTARNVTKYSPSGTLLQTFQANGNRCVQYEGVAVDTSGNVYISNPFPLNNIMIYSPAGTLIGTLT
jgi:sugar lactone lactonase YvrE